MGWNGWWIGHQGRALTLVPACVCLALLDPLGLLKVLAWAWDVFLLATKFTALETLDSRGEACVWLDELDAELVQTESLQGLGTFLVSVDLIESVRHVVTSRTYKPNQDDQSLSFE